MNEYKVSVIIPIYNCEKFLEECINSLKEQTIGFYDNIEVIIVNDGSTDNTERILKEISRKYKNCKIYNLKKNTGNPAQPVNIGINHASSDFLMFLDCDDTYAPSMCEVLYNIISKTNINIVMCNHDELVNGTSIIKKDMENLELKIYYPKKDLEIFKLGFRWDKIFNKRFILENNIKNPTNNILGEDWVFCVNAYLNTDKVAYLKNFYGYNYNLQESNNSKSLTHIFTFDMIRKSIKGSFCLINLLKNKKRCDVINFLSGILITNILISFIKSKENVDNKLKILNEIYDFERRIQIDIKFKEKWLCIFNYLIIKQKFYVVIIFSNMIRLIYNINFIKNNHRKKVQKYNHL